MNLPSIISNTCWGGMLYEFREEQFRTPFTGSYILADDYIKLLKELDNIDLGDIKFSLSTSSNSPEYKLQPREEIHPMGILSNGVEIHFPHFSSIEETSSKWFRRLSRFDRDNIIVKIGRIRLVTDYHLKQFISLTQYDRKVLVVDDTLRWIKYSSNNLLVVQSKVSGIIGENIRFVDDEPLESLHNLNYKLFEFEFDKTHILKSLNWI